MGTCTERNCPQIPSPERVPPVISSNAPPPPAPRVHALGCGDPVGHKDSLHYHPTLPGPEPITGSLGFPDFLPPHLD